MNITVIKELMAIGAEYQNAKFEVTETEVGITSAKVAFDIPISLYGQPKYIEVEYNYYTNPKTEILKLYLADNTQTKNVYALTRLADVQDESIWKIAEKVCEDYRKHFNVSLKGKK